MPEEEIVIETYPTANSPPSEHSLTSFFSANSAINEISATRIPENSEFEVQIVKTVTESEEMGDEAKADKEKEADMQEDISIEEFVQEALRKATETGKEIPLIPLTLQPEKTVASPPPDEKRNQRNLTQKRRTESRPKWQ